MARDLEQYVQDRISEALNAEKDTAANLISTVEGLESDFDLDSFAPYTSEEDDILSDYESEHWQDAKDMLGDATYTADDWSAAKRAYVAAVAYCAHSSLFETAKSELTEALDEFADAARELMDEDADEPVIEVTMSCVHGWAPHDREDSDGLMIWEPGQLEGCRAISRQVGELWLTCTWTPAKESE
jgi:hypothetical protein